MVIELHTPAIAPLVPMRIKCWSSFSATNASQREAKLAYIKLNSKTSCPPRGAVPVNRGRTWETLSFCSIRLAFGHGCDRPSYVGN
jgi:hypothetical protein